MDRDSLVTLQDLVKHLPQHVYWLDKDGLYLGCNDPQAKALGLPSPEMIRGRSTRNLPSFNKHPELADVIDHNNSTILQSGKPMSLEETVPDPHNMLSKYHSYKVPLRDSNNNVIGLLGTSSKIEHSQSKEHIESTLNSIIAQLD